MAEISLDYEIIVGECVRDKLPVRLWFDVIYSCRSCNTYYYIGLDSGAVLALTKHSIAKSDIYVGRLEKDTSGYRHEILVVFRAGAVTGINTHNNTIIVDCKAGALTLKITNGRLVWEWSRKL